jgi:hypothetical protein
MSQFDEADVDANIWWFRVGNKHTDGRNKSIDGDTRLVEVDTSVAEPKWFHRMERNLEWGVPVKPDHVLTRYRWHGAAPSDVDHCEGSIMVSERFREIVERFEAGLHQFFPVSLVGTHKSVVATRYLIIPNVALRCFSRLSIGYEPLGWEKHWGDHIWHVQGSARSPRLIFEDRAVKGHHLWVPIDYTIRGFFVSSELKRALLDADLSNMKFIPMESREKLRWMLPEVVKSRFAQDPPWTDWVDN